MTTEEKKDDRVSINKPVNFGLKGLHARVANRVNNPLVGGVATGVPGGNARMVNFGKIFIFPDTSGSMSSFYDGKTALELLKTATEDYIKNCNPITNHIGVASFPEAVFIQPTGNHLAVVQEIKKLEPDGGTPLHEAFGYVLENEPMTHAVIISDGDADSPGEVEQLARAYKQKNITVDTVHIGNSHHGEELLKHIAEITGGIYIKFDNVTNFSKAFSFLSPAKRVQLLTSKNPVALLGAGEVKL